MYLFQAVDTVVQVLKEIEEVAPSKDQYSNLCLLLTMNKLSDHPDYKSWNPSKGRHKSFREVLPLVEDLLGKHSDLECPMTFVNSKMTKFQIFNFFLL